MVIELKEIILCVLLNQLNNKKENEVWIDLCL